MLKDALLKHYWAQRCFVQPEVEIIPSETLGRDLRLVTDVDVYALRPHPDLYFERILGDCRTLQKQSPINRALWLGGLMRYIGARAGTLLLKVPGGHIEPDHKLAANKVGVVLIDEADFSLFDRAKLP